MKHQSEKGDREEKEERERKREELRQKEERVVERDLGEKVGDKEERKVEGK